LARDLVRLSGLKEDDVEIVFTGLRPGEKLYEELYFEDEKMLPTPHRKLFVAYHRPYALEEVNASIAEVSALVHASQDDLRLKIKELVAEYAESNSSPPPPRPPQQAAEDTAEAEAEPSTLPTRRTGGSSNEARIP
jgi:FlaA1/EpsC-like NDP-sugar epimerase